MEEKLELIVELLLKDRSETFSIVVSLITVGTAVWAVFLLHRGLNQWKKQINHKHTHDILVWAHKFLNMMEHLTGNMTFVGEGKEILEVKCTEQFQKYPVNLRLACRYVSRRKLYDDLMLEYETVRITAKLSHPDLLKKLEKLRRHLSDLDSYASIILKYYNYGKDYHSIDPVVLQLIEEFDDYTSEIRQLSDGDDIIIPNIKGIIEKMEKNNTA